MAESPLRPIRRSALYEEVVDRLREFIDVHELQPGDKLMPERELAEQLGVSRTSVRQALTGLRPLFPGLDGAIARAAELAAHEDAATPRAGLRRQVREAVEGDCGLKDVAFAHVEAAVLALERGGSGRFYMKDGVDLIIEAGRLRVETHE